MLPFTRQSFMENNGETASTLAPYRLSTRDRSGAVAHLRDTFLFGAMGAAVDRTVVFHSMPHNMRAAMGAGRREGLDCAFEAVKDVILAVQNDLKRLVVVIAASLAYRHCCLPKSEERKYVMRNPGWRRVVPYFAAVVV